MERIRVASLQYFIRPVRTFGDLSAQVERLVETAADYKCQLLVFPEYFTVQLLTLGDIRPPIDLQVRTLAAQLPDFVECIGTLAKRHNLHIVAGTIPVLTGTADDVLNVSYFFTPHGTHACQPKLHTTRFEREDWRVSPGARLRVFETSLGRVAIAICYDVEFPEIARSAAARGAQILVVSSCTDDRQGYLRVRYCAQARVVENQMYVIQSSTVGSLPMVPAVSLNYGQAAILTPSDFAFSRDGILAEGIPNQETMIIGELNLATIVDARSGGTVLPLLDSGRTAEIAARAAVVSL